MKKTFLQVITFAALGFGAMIPEAQSCQDSSDCTDPKKPYCCAVGLAGGYCNASAWCM